MTAEIADQAGKQLPEEIHIACEKGRWNDIRTRLRSQAPDEACVFVVARPSRGLTRTTLILKEALWPAPSEVTATPLSLEVSADYISRAIDAAIDAGDLAGLVLIHTHPDGPIGFSPRDDWYEARLFPTIALGRPKAISGSIVITSTTDDVDARVWWNGGDGLQTRAVQVLRVVGPEISFFETPHSTWTDHPDPTIMDRSTRLWGVEGRKILQNLRIGIVGVGGTGSIALLSLATMGVGKIRAWDQDQVGKENLTRILGATKDMVGDRKVKALTPLINSIATAQPFLFEPIPQSGTSVEGLRRLKDCDLVFCCVDKFAPRVPLNDLAYAHLIPVLDMASWIHSSKGEVDSIMTHAHILSPGMPCAWCQQTLTSFRLMREAQGNQGGIEHRVPYGLRLDETDGVEPSVLPLNLTGVGLALLEFMQVALGITTRSPRDLKIFLPEWELDESDLASIPDCSTEANTGLGDVVNIRPA